MTSTATGKHPFVFPKIYPMRLQLRALSKNFDLDQKTQSELKQMGVLPEKWRAFEDIRGEYSRKKPPFDEKAA
jgi:hypothetical protein